MLQIDRWRASSGCRTNGFKSGQVSQFMLNNNRVDYFCPVVPITVGRAYRPIVDTESRKRVGNKTNPGLNGHTGKELPVAEHNEIRIELAKALECRTMH